jgi:hypothetical protein
MVDGSHSTGIGVAFSFGVLMLPTTPRLIKDGPLYKAIRMAPETHTAVPRTLRMPCFVEILIASTLKIVQVFFRMHACSWPLNL